jgi:hypothetical protein
MNSRDESMNKFDGNLAKKISEPTTNPMAALDRLFLAILRDQFNEAIDQAAGATEQVLKISSHFLSEPATDLLRQFQSLYFSNGSVSKKNMDINRNVDDLVDQAMHQVAEGRDVIKVIETQLDEQDRIELAALQRRLEALISIDGNIRKHIIPSVATMQFEDAVRQRLDHIWQAWTTTVVALSEPSWDLEKLKDNLEDLPTSVAEAEDFFNMVLHRTPPAEGAMPEQMILF